MSSTIYPIASSASAPNAKSYTVPTALKKYKITSTFDPAVYNIATSPSTSEATISFWNSSTNSYTDVTTNGGTIDYNLATGVTEIWMSINTGSNVVVTITTKASSLSGAEFSGTLDTITSTSTYNQTGRVYVLAFGGGGGGGRGGAEQFGGGGTAHGGGGGAGGMAYGIFYLNSSTSIQIGSGGAGALASTSGGSTGGTGGTTNFGNLLSAGGANGGNPGTDSGSGVGGAGGNGSGPGGRGSSSANVGNNGSPSGVVTPTITNGTTGGGGGGGGLSGAGSGIGTGGSSGLSGTGYAAGGGGGNYRGNPGGSGTAGVVYVLRGF